MRDYERDTRRKRKWEGMYFVRLLSRILPLRCEKLDMMKCWRTFTPSDYRLLPNQRLATSGKNEDQLYHTSLEHSSLLLVRGVLQRRQSYPRHGTRHLAFELSDLFVAAISLGLAPGLVTL
jgi:hypothetical protein